MKRGCSSTFHELAILFFQQMPSLRTWRNLNCECKGVGLRAFAGTGTQLASFCASRHRTGPRCLHTAAQAHNYPTPRRVSVIFSRPSPGPRGPPRRSGEPWTRETDAPVRSTQSLSHSRRASRCFWRQDATYDTRPSRAACSLV